MTIDLNELYASARASWIAGQVEQRGLVNSVKRSEPYWLIIIGVVMFILSASHTANTFDRLIAPVDIGSIRLHPAWLAPFGIEFGILYCAFGRKRAKQFNQAAPLNLAGFELLMVLTSVVVNGAGALFVVISYSNITQMSINAVIQGFGALPADLQIALVIALVFALIIPWSTHVTGEGLAALVFDYTDGSVKYDAAWKLVERDQFYKAVYQALVDNGLQYGRARRDATTMVNGFLGRLQPAQPAQPSSTSVNQSQPTAPADEYKNVDEVVSMLASRPDWLQLTDRALMIEAGCSQYTARQAKLKYKNAGASVDAPLAHPVSTNGHHLPESMEDENV